MCVHAGCQREARDLVGQGLTPPPASSHPPAIHTNII